jgi:hypothetical protein
MEKPASLDDHGYIAECADWVLVLYDPSKPTPQPHVHPQYPVSTDTFWTVLRPPPRQMQAQVGGTDSGPNCCELPTNLIS